MTAGGGGITPLLLRGSNGDRRARDGLMTLVYGEPMPLAGRYPRPEARHRTLQPSAFGCGADRRLIEQDKVSFQNRAQFYGLCATIMRNILIDRARSRKNKKRSGGWRRISIRDADRINRKPDLDVIAVDEALNKLAAIKPRHA